MSLPVKADIQAQFSEQIQQAEARLKATQKQVNKEKTALHHQLRALEQEVLALRDKTSVARRQADEKTLSLKQLENRLSDWIKQAEFQQNLLDRFLQQQGRSYAELSRLSNAEKIVLVKTYAQEVRGDLQPSWQKNKVILPNGELVPAKTLTIGPVTWFVSENQQVGLAEQADTHFKAQALLPENYAKHVSQLDEQQPGLLPLDTSLGRALVREQTVESPIQHIVKGGIWVVPIVFFAILALFIALVKVVQLGRLPKLLELTPAQSKQLVLGQSDLFDELKGMQQQLLKVARQATSVQAREDQLFIALQSNKTELEKWLNVIAVTAAVAPLLGLLGTVSGMIETFKMMTAFGSSDPEVISGGIAKALITTELGLVVAIPALILNAVLSRWARKYYTQLENFALQLSTPSDASASTSEDKVCGSN